MLHTSKHGEYSGVFSYVDENGEIRISAPSNTHKVVSNKQSEAYKAKKEREDSADRDGRHYVNCYHDPISELNEILGVNELGALMKMLPYLRINTGGQLVHNGKRMGAKEISKAIGKSIRWTTELIKKLTDEGVLIADKDGRRNVYNISEYYHTIGYTLKESYFTKVYQTKTRSDIKNISIQSAGVLYKMLPYFHYSRYYLVENPNDPDVDSLRHLTQNNFASKVNVHRTVVNRAVKELCTEGFVMISKTFGSDVIRVNPDVMFRQKGDNEYTKEVRYDFEQNRKSSEQNR